MERRQLRLQEIARARDSSRTRGRKRIAKVEKDKYHGNAKKGKTNRKVILNTEGPLFAVPSIN
eukprot:4222190-Ditylum_brightwellii.AAC.1